MSRLRGVSRRRQLTDESRYDVRVDCECGYHLGFMKKDAAGWTNADARQQADPPRMALVNGVWHGNCKCGSNPRVREDRLERALVTVSVAGLKRMPFRGL